MMVQRLDGEAQTVFSKQSFFSRTITTSANIAAGGVSIERFISEDDEWAHAPFDAMLISNSDTVDLGIRLDQNPDNVVPVPASSIIAVTKAMFRNFSIENQNAAAAHTAGKIRILVMNTERPRRK
jgi:hypothetical protein